MCETLYRIKPSLWMSVLQIPQRPGVGFPCFIAFLNSLIFSRFFTSWGKISQIFDPRNFILSVPLITAVQKRGFENLSVFLIVKHCIFKLKNLFHNLRTYIFENFKHFNCLKSDILMVSRNRSTSFGKLFKTWFFIVVNSVQTLLMQSVYFIIQSTISTQPNKGTIVKLRLEEKIH